MRGRRSGAVLHPSGADYLASRPGFPAVPLLEPSLSADYLDKIDRLRPHPGLAARAIETAQHGPSPC